MLNFWVLKRFPKKINKISSKNSKVIIGSGLSSIQSKNVEYLEYKQKDFLNKFLKDLLKRDISSILVEGGQKTLSSFISKNLFDELVLYTAPMFLGKESKETVNLIAPDAINKSKKLKLVNTQRFKNDINSISIFCIQFSCSCINHVHNLHTYICI